VRLAALVLTLLAATTSAAAAPLAQPGKTYSYSSVRDGAAYGGKWQDDRKSILQSDSSARVGFPLFVFDSPRFRNLEYRGEFLIESGVEDRYAGFVFRLRDPGNYYAVRFSASENNIFFARFDDGVRTVLKAFDAQVSSKQWHAIRLVVGGNTVAIFLDGRRIGTAADSKWRVGKVGLNTKADSVTRFRKLTVERR
jgi:hypothetical protein